jgi:hypothetical protein
MLQNPTLYCVCFFQKALKLLNCKILKFSFYFSDDAATVSEHGQNNNESEPLQPDEQKRPQRSAGTTSDGNATATHGLHGPWHGNGSKADDARRTSRDGWADGSHDGRDAEPDGP